MNVREPTPEPLELEPWETEGPPLNYYIGYRKQENGVSIVIYSSEFHEILKQSPYATKFLPSMDHHSCKPSDTLSIQV